MTALVFQYNNIAGSLPKVGYFKGIDLWMLTCFFFVVFALLEYTFLAYMKRIVYDDGSKPVIWFKSGFKDKPVTEGVYGNTEDSEVIGPKKSRMTVKQLENIADYISRYVFMALFLIFTVSYFVYYAVIE